jgi:hypothetical protein
MDDSIWGNLFTADDPMTPQLEFRGGNGHTSKTVIIRSGMCLRTMRVMALLSPGLFSTGHNYLHFQDTNCLLRYMGFFHNILDKYAS